MDAENLFVMLIDGAVTFADSAKDGELYKIAAMNPDYKFVTVIEGYPYVSKDGNKWVVALSVLSDGQTIYGGNVVETIQFFNKIKDHPLIKKVLYDFAEIKKLG